MPRLPQSWLTLRTSSSAVSLVAKGTSHTSNAVHTMPDRPVRLLRPPQHQGLQRFSTSAQHHKKTPPLPPRPTLPSDDIIHVYLKGSGPGGQKINKTNSAAQLTHLPTGIVVKSQATRSRLQNYNIARRILAEKVELLEKGDESRVMKRQEFDRKKKASKSKKSRRKYRALEARDGEQDEGEVEVEDDAGALAAGLEAPGSHERLPGGDRGAIKSATALSVSKKEAARSNSTDSPI
ncbi:hypothetical protein LTR84_007939 [Exophiala bonariae]|uniref:Prokaryotic-type class I peptide chain release factors domain-containing protein n=1 Tax=Exophiala bonariae TaxID=1690606 RepID=A0AAV9NNX5_9EURO|nr:hypothetical protein LTR84_007939 [Exophiala bonariae]